MAVGPHDTRYTKKNDTEEASKSTASPTPKAKVQEGKKESDKVLDEPPLPNQNNSLRLNKKTSNQEATPRHCCLDIRRRRRCSGEGGGGCPTPSGTFKTL